MPIPGSGPVSSQDIQTEFGGTNPIGLNEYYRGGGFVPNLPQNSRIPLSGTISNSDFYNSSFRVQIPLSISTPTYNYNVYARAIANPAYFAGLSDIRVTVNPGVQVGSTATNTYAMTVANTFNPTDTVTITNNGFIQGMGGYGGGGQGLPGTPGGGGGNALFLGRPTSINNLGTIASGGGGGGGGAVYVPNKGGSVEGGGGGGGAGFNGGAGGGGSYPGSPGTASSGGAGAAVPSYAPGGAGGGRGANGAYGSGISGANPGSGGVGGNTGYYIVGNPFATWIANGTRQGNVG
jgi:hypothetical protein